MHIEEAKKVVFEKKPVFGKLYTNYKDKHWSEYINEHHPKTEQNTLDPILEKVFLKVTTNILGETLATEALTSLKQTHFVDTADHHGLLCHPFFWNFDALKSGLRITEKPKTQIVLTVGNISPNNTSFPRSLFFHNQHLDLQKIHFLSLKHRRKPLYGSTPLSREQITTIKDSLWIEKIPKTAKKRLATLLDTFSKDPHFPQETFGKQLTLLNHLWWKALWAETYGNLLYLEVEEVVRELLITSLSDENSHTYKILLDKDIRERYISSFAKVTGAHDIETQKGSVLFWYIDTDERKALFLHEDHLETSDGIKVPFEFEALQQLTSNRTLVPTMALCYSLLSFGYGLTLGGGFSQIQYVETMKTAWIKVFPEDEEKVKPTRTDIFSGEIGLLHIKKDKEITLATLADLYVWTETPEERVTLMEAVAQETTIGESLDAMMYEFLEIVNNQYEVIEGVSTPKTTLQILS